MSVKAFFMSGEAALSGEPAEAGEPAMSGKANLLYPQTGLNCMICSSDAELIDLADESSRVRSDWTRIMNITNF